MQGYYVYKIYGTTEELKDFLKKLKELENTATCFKEFNSPDLQNTEYIEQKDGESRIELGTVDGPRVIDPYMFPIIDDTMEKLSSAFPEYKIEAECYDCGHEDVIIRALTLAGSSEFTEKFDHGDNMQYVDFACYDTEKDCFEVIDSLIGHLGFVPADCFRNKEGEFEDDKEVDYQFDEFGKARVCFWFDGIENYDSPYIIDMNDYVEADDCFAFEKEGKTFNVPGKFFRDKNGEYKSKQIVVNNDDCRYLIYFKDQK